MADKKLYVVKRDGRNGRGQCWAVLVFYILMFPFLCDICFKLYLSDIGLFTTMLFNDAQKGIEDIYKKLLRDTLTADLGYLYENVVAQAIKASGRDLYYHTWRKEGSTHSFEIDFLVTSKNKMVLGEQKEIQEVKNAYAAYERFSEIQPFSIRMTFLHG